GRAIVWANQSTRFLGTLKANAGAAGGNGGFVEVSGKTFLDFNPRSVVDLSAANGKTGTLLLDPAALHIGATNPGTAVSFLDVSILEDQLANGNVTLETTINDGDGTVTFAAPVAWESANTLRVESFDDIYLEADLTAPHGAIEFYPGPSGTFQPQNQDGGMRFLSPRVEQAADTTLEAGRLTYGTNDVPLPEEWDAEGGAGSAFFDGNLNVGTIEIDLDHGGTGIIAGGINNTISSIRTIGTGALEFFYVENHHGPLNLRLNSTNATAGAITAISAGNLTLEAGSEFNFNNTESRNAVLASRDGNVVNQAGAAAFGEKTRAVFYSNTNVPSNKGGLAGIDIYNHAFPADGSEDLDGFATSNLFFFAGDSGLPLLTYTANNLSRLYGAPNPTFTATVTGLLNDDQLADVVTGAPSFSTAATQSSGVNTYAITVAQGTLTSTNYGFDFVPGTLTITPAPLTITANDTDRRLNRNNPTFSASFDGFVNGDTSAVVSGLQFSTTATLVSPAGNYAITPYGATAA
ncbi:MAG TPA: MBG domain-containing protein, partial [Opitutus sp.]|nr:MBG domain-containing protein [Opitutus sp.]